jgi:DNA-binding CsgD family transcriptional regulator/tetratricopeptide (TPR) repeat protein
MAEPAPELVEAGEAALAAGDWAAARSAFETALAGGESPAARDGLGRALWWTDGEAAAVAHRTRAYAAYRRAGDDRAAARVALWLAHEYVAAYGNRPAAGGWLTRAARLLDGAREGPEHARLELGRGEQAPDPLESARYAKSALATARRLGDADLEITALGRLGLAEVRLGAVESGMARFDEAMAAALGGEANQLETLGELCCELLAACDLTGDVERLGQWNRLLDEATHGRRELPVMSFCSCCSAETLIAGGRTDAAERELARALRAAEQSGVHSRCVDPRARLADLLVRQGRFEEAEQLLPGADGDGWTVRARAELHLARGEPRAAAAVLERRLRQIGEVSLLAVSVLDLLVAARIAEGRLEQAADAAARLGALADSSEIERVLAYGERARGRVAAASGEDRALDLLERALALFGRLGMAVEAGRTRLDLARALERVDRVAAVTEARGAMAALHAAGAPYERDAAAALLRELGDEARPPSGQGAEQLTARELGVLRLLGEGLTNAEVGARLFISTKTAGNHVSSILMKLSLRNRSQAAAFARTHLEERQVAE